MNKTALLSLLAGVSVPFADAGMPPNSPSEWNPCTITTTLPPSQVVTQAPRVTLTLDEHDKFVKASQQTTSAVSPNQPPPSPASSPPTNTSVTGINESKFPISTALFEPLSALVNTLPSSGLKTAPPDAIGSETSVRVHTQKTQPHSVITFVTHTRKEVLSTASGLEGNRDVYQESKAVEDWAVATSLSATTFITPTPSELDELSLPSTPATLEIIALSSSTSILKDADNPTASSSVQPSQTQVSAAVSTRVMGSWRSILSFIIMVLFLTI